MALTTVDGGLLSSTNAQYTGFKNRIINGAMGIWQRATSYSGTPSIVAYGSADRWAFYSTSAITASQSTSVPSGFQYSLKVQRPNAATTTNQIYAFQVVETNNMLDLVGQTVTLSFWAKAGANFSASGSTISVFVNTGTVADQGSVSGLGGWTGSATPLSLSQTITTTWTRYSVTGTISSSALELDAGFYYSPAGTAGADDAFYITGVQLEKGSTATSFDYRPYGTELALCQRYFEMSYDQGTAIGTATASGTTYVTATSDSANSFVVSVSYAVVKRATPTITFYNPSTGASGTWRYARNGVAETNNTMNTLNLGTRVLNCFGNIGAAWTAAYQYGHWIASSEL